VNARPRNERRAWSRPQPTAIGPDRSIGGYYRGSDLNVRGRDLRGVPLQTAEDAAVAAVRLGYRVVDAQIERGLDMARRLRGASKRAGAGDARDVLDSTERLLSRSVLLGLEWLETTVNQPGNPVRRLLTTQFRLMASLFGVEMKDTVPRAAESRPLSSLLGVDLEDLISRLTKASKRQDTESPATPTVTPTEGFGTHRQVRIRHAKDTANRAVTVVRFDLYPPFPSASTARELEFHYVPETRSETLNGTLTVGPQEPVVLEVRTRPDHVAGRWRAAVCEDNGDQVGIIEIDL
jgi:hypothetical protein